MKPVLFISHSSADRARAEQLVAAIEARGQFRAVIDTRDLQPGQEYTPQLFHWMAGCQGGVLLLTQQVMTNAAWVLQEATVLRARARLEGEAFRLYVLIDAEVHDDPVFTRWFAPLNLGALQRLKKLAPADRDQGVFTPAALADAVEALHASMAGLAETDTDFFGRLATLIGQDLQPLLAHDGVSKGLAQALQEPDARWQRLVQGERALQGLLARHLCNGDFGVHEDLEGFSQRLVPVHATHHDQLQQLYGTLRSHWVLLANGARVQEALQAMRQAAGPVPAGQLPPNLLLLGTAAGSRVTVAQMVAERWLLPQQGSLGQWCEVALANVGQGALREQVLDAVAHTIYGRSMDPARLVAKRAEKLLEPAPVPTLVHLDGGPSLEHLLPLARECWPFLFLVTATPPACAELQARWGVDAIVHPPGPRTEEDHFDDLAAAARLLKLQLGT